MLSRRVPQCARDSGVGLACSEACEAQVKAVHALVEKNKKLTALAPKPYTRNAFMLALMAVTFIGFGLISKIPFMSAYLLVFGVVLLCGAALAFFNGRKVAKAALPEIN